MGHPGWVVRVSTQSAIDASVAKVDAVAQHLRSLTGSYKNQKYAITPILHDAVPYTPGGCELRPVRTSHGEYSA